MTTTHLPTRAAALLTGAATAAYYATPDFVSSRSARTWVKAGLITVNLAAALPDLAAARGRRAGRTGPAEWWRSMDSRQRISVSAFASVIVPGVVGLTAAAERQIFRRGQAKAAAGVRLPHTRAGLGYGLLAAGLASVPMPVEQQLGDGGPGA